MSTALQSGKRKSGESVLGRVQKKGNSGKAGLLTLQKGLSVLEAIAALGGSRGVTANEIAHCVALNKSTLYRFLSTLQARGYIQQDGNSDRYRLGFGVFDLAVALLDGMELRQVAGPFLEELNRLTGETVQVVALDKDEIVTIDKIEGRSPYALRLTIGERRAPHCTAAGKALVAFLSEDALDAILAKGMPAHTKHTITSPAQLREELCNVRRLGYAIDDEEFLEGMRCTAAPIFDFTRRAIGAVSLPALATYTSLHKVNELGLQVKDTARRISQRLGYRPQPGDAF